MTSEGRDLKPLFVNFGCFFGDNGMAFVGILGYCHFCYLWHIRLWTPKFSIHNLNLNLEVNYLESFSNLQFFEVDVFLYTFSVIRM